MGSNISNEHKNIISKSRFCDCNIYGEWVVSLITERDQNGIIVKDLFKYINNNDKHQYQINYSNETAYFRKHTKPSSDNLFIYTNEIINNKCFYSLYKK